MYSASDELNTDEFLVIDNNPDFHNSDNYKAITNTATKTVTINAMM